MHIFKKTRLAKTGIACLAVFCLFSALSCTETLEAPDFSSMEWHSLTAKFCTESTAQEIWITTDPDKLLLLQGALWVEKPVYIDHIIKSHNHAIELEVSGKQGRETWAMVLNRDQNHASFFNKANPAHSFKADSDAMFYRVLNTLLKSHMNESLDIFRNCEMPDATTKG